MPMTQIPPYLLSAIRVARDDAATAALITGESDERPVAAAAELSEQLAAWAADGNFWDTTAQTLFQAPAQISAKDLEAWLDDEQTLLANALGGDPQLATLILVNAPLRSDRADPQRARLVVVQLQAECAQVRAEQQPRGRLWRAARVFRKAFKAVGGGILVAADIVSPDPTQLVRIASILGGIDMILDAA